MLDGTAGRTVIALPDQPRPATGCQAALALLTDRFVDVGLVVVDLAGMTLTQHIGGALAERIATNTAESMYAGQRMARIGLITMGMCRPVPFQPSEVPGLFSSMIGNLFARKKEPKKEIVD